MKHIYLLFIFVTTISFGQLEPPPALQDYYGDVFDETTPSLLLDDLAVLTIAKHTNILSYSQRHDYLYDADENLSNADNVILMYSGESRSDDEWLSTSNPNTTQTFNTEHVFPQSLIVNTAKGDLHHLRSCDVSINSDRGNMPFGAGSGTYADLGSSWYPGDEWKGDVARMIMYLNLRYDEDFLEVGTLALFLQWNAEDDVSDFEMNRNALISGVQGARNPFIDNPYIATALWGGPAAQNRWETLSIDDVTQNKIKVFPNPVVGNKLYFESTTTLKVSVYDVLGKRVMESNIDGRNNYMDISSMRKGIYILMMKSDKGTTTKKLIRQ